MTNQQLYSRSRPGAHHNKKLQIFYEQTLRQRASMGDKGAQRLVGKIDKAVVDFYKRQFSKQEIKALYEQRPQSVDSETLKAIKG